MQERLAVLLASARLPFLVLTPVSILLGLACALTVTQEIDWLKLAIILLTAMSAHVSVNALNEYGDFRIGLDDVTERTPFSGGSGALPAHPKQARSVLLLGAGALVYLFFTLSAAAMIITGILLARMPGISIISLIPLLFALPVAPLAAQRIGQRGKLIPLMAVNLATTLLVPVVLALSMLMAQGVRDAFA